MTLIGTYRDPAATEDPHELRGGRLGVVTASPGLSFSVDTARPRQTAAVAALGLYD